MATTVGARLNSRSETIPSQQRQRRTIIRSGIIATITDIKDRHTIRRLLEKRPRVTMKQNKLPNIIASSTSSNNSIVNARLPVALKVTTISTTLRPRRHLSLLPLLPSL
jgi:hypothetical protein